MEDIPREMGGVERPSRRDKRGQEGLWEGLEKLGGPPDRVGRPSKRAGRRRLSRELVGVGRLSRMARRGWEALQEVRV